MELKTIREANRQELNLIQKYLNNYLSVLFNGKINYIDYLNINQLKQDKERLIKLNSIINKELIKYKPNKKVLDIEKDLILFEN